MTSKVNLSLVALSAVTFIPSVAAAAERPEKPNVVFILADDLGWQDVKCYDIDAPSVYETPNIDKLASEGVMFWQAYSPAPTSAPSRGAMLSGKHPARLQRTHVVGGAPVLPLGLNSSIMTPWYSGRLSVDEITIPEMLKAQGYVSGHSGKWHMAIGHHSSLNAKDQGFDFSDSSRGATDRMKKGRHIEFATTAASDPYRLDERGVPRDQVTLSALEFMDKNKKQPFFLYLATWLVHAPIQTRSRILLEKYCQRMNLPFPESADDLKVTGQNNPYYGAMVEMLDAYVGDVMDYLKTTEDPRWKGHKLIENTYIIFTSDNGGCEGFSEVYTDNAPLDKGKIHAEEGGTRVPFIISGPGIKKGVKTDVMASGLDIMPTIMSWTGVEIDKNQIYDGADLSVMLKKNPQDASLVKTQNAQVRDMIFHHFPHNRMHSTIRIGSYKLFHNYTPKEEPYRLYQLYDEKTGKRVDIEESNDLAKAMPEKVAEMDKLLMAKLESMDASYPYLNPKAKAFEKRVGQMCKITDSGSNGKNIWMSFSESKNKAIRVDVLYTNNGGANDEEWFRIKDVKFSNGRAECTLPKDATHYLWGLVDDANFYYGYPDLGASKDYNAKKGIYFSKNALKIK